jgi:osmotically inducible protein OsmC
MPVRKADAEWTGGLKDGKGTMKLATGAYHGAYSFSSRFEEGSGTNPEELIGGAHAGCYSMALSATLEKNGFKPRRVKTSAKVSIEKVGEGFKITKIELDSEAEVPGIDKKVFMDLAEKTKTGCPVSQALASVPIHLNARLLG